MRTTLSLVAAVGLALALALLPDGANAAPTGTTCTGALCQVDATGDIRTNSGAATESFEVELCVTNAAARNPGSDYYLSAAKSLYVENRSSATCYVTFDAQSITSTGSTGYKFAAGTERSFDVDGSIFGPLMRVACTAAQTTGACLFLGWWK